MKLLKLENLVTVQQYAGLCGIKPTAVYRRLAVGSIKQVIIGGVKFIDVSIHPPMNRNPKGQRSPGHPYSTVTAADAIGRNITLAHLLPARKYARKVRVSTATIYHRIIMKAMETVIIDDEIFIDTEKYPPAEFRPNRKPPRKGWEIREQRLNRNQ